MSTPSTGFGTWSFGGSTACTTGSSTAGGRKASSAPGGPARYDIAHVEGEDDDPKARDKLTSALNGELESVSFSAHRRDAGEPFLVQLECHALLDEPSCLELRLDLYHSVAGASSVDTDALEADVLDLVREFIGAWRPSFVGLSDDFGPASFSLDAAQNLNGRVARLDEQHLRGYCWITYCPSRFLGTLPDLNASDAFVPDRRHAGWRPVAGDRAPTGFRRETGPGGARRLGASPRDRPALPPRQPGAWMRERHLRIAWDDGQDGPVAPPATRQSAPHSPPKGARRGDALLAGQILDAHAHAALRAATLARPCRDPVGSTAGKMP